MKRLPEDALAILELARDADDPTPKQRERADAALRSTLGAYGIGTLPPLPPPAQPGVDALAGASQGSAGSAASWTLGGKVLIAALISTAAAAAVIAGVLTQAAPPGPQPPPAPRVGDSAAQARVLVAPTPTATPADQGQASSASTPHIERRHATDGQASIQATRHRARPVRARGSRADVPGDASMLAQLRLISDANRALRAGRTERALTLLDEYDGQFEQGFLAAESRALRALARCSMNDTPSERVERARALRSARGSVLAARVRAACAADDDP